jgi:hypothetical protein
MRRNEATKCFGRTEGSEKKEGPGVHANELQHVSEQTVIRNALKFCREIKKRMKA